MPFDTPPPPPEIVVRAARLPDPPGDPAFSIITIAPDALETAGRLDDALETAPGVSLYRRTSSLAANPTTQGVSLRGIAGSGASRALVTLDGVPQNDPFGGWVIWTGLPSETIGRASVIRGAGSGPYGAGALTGVVALDSPSSLPGGVIADLEGGTEGYARGAGVVETAVGGAKVLLSASGEHNDGWVPVRYGEGAADQPLSLDDWSASERIEAPLGDAVLSERVGTFQEDRGAGTRFANSHARGLQGSLALVRQPTADSLGWRVQGWVEGSNLANTSASVSADRNTATLADNQYATPATGLGVNAALRRTAPGYSWEAGLDVRDFSGDSKERLYNQGVPTGVRFSGGAQTLAGAYAEGTLSLGRTLLTGGVRLDGWTSVASRLIQSGSSPLNERYPDQGGVVPTGRLGARRDLFGDVYGRAAVYAGFRPPTLNELHRAFRVGNDVTEANPALTPEKLYGAEIGLGGGRRAVWDVDLFYNRLADAVTNVTIGHGPGTFAIAGFVPAGGTLYERENAGAVNAWGVEGEARRPVGRALSLRAAVSYTHAQVDGGSAAPQLTGLKPAETPSLTVTAGATWRPVPRLTLTAEGRYESARYDDDQNTRRIAPGLGVDARAEWRVRGALSAYLAAENLFDADLQTGRSATGVVTYDAPRLVRVGLAYRE